MQELVRFALIGHPLSHSFSERFFQEKFRKEGLSGYRYENLDVEDPDAVFPQLKKQALYRGFNVTAPYKQIILPYIDELSPQAKAVGAVNVIKVCGQRWFGFNTDCAGFSESLEHFLPETCRMAESLAGPAGGQIAEEASLRAMVLGNGGASRAVQHVLGRKKIPFVLVCREPSRAEGLLPEACVAKSYAEVDEACLQACRLVVNATSLGMYPHAGSAPPIPYAAAGSAHRAFDLVYNPACTLFMARFAEAGAQVKNGLEMLHVQAREAWKIWTSPLQGSGLSRH